MLTSHTCIFRDFEQPWYRDWLCELKEGFILHRKPWEFVVVAQALHERGKMGLAGLGFAVGTEPLPSLFAAHHCRILATDQPTTDEAYRAWGDGQLAVDKASLNSRGICHPKEFEYLCQFEHLNMLEHRDDLNGHADFLWSCCALEHLGSLQAGLDFILDSTRYLKPGGVACHTTEFNLSSNHDTVAIGGSVYYRQQDIAWLAGALCAVGCNLCPVDWSEASMWGTHPIDDIVDKPPHKPPHCHLKLTLDGYVLTSILLIIEKL